MLHLSPWVAADQTTHPMANRAIDERLLLFELNLDAVRLPLKTGNLYEGTIEKDFFRRNWQLRRRRRRFQANLRQDAIQFEVEDVEGVAPLDHILTSAWLNVSQGFCMQQGEKPKKYKAVRVWLQDGSRTLGMWTGDRWWSIKGEVNPAGWELEERKKKRTKELLKIMKYAKRPPGD